MQVPVLPIRIIGLLVKQRYFVSSTCESGDILAVWHIARLPCAAHFFECATNHVNLLWRKCVETQCEILKQPFLVSFILIVFLETRAWAVSRRKNNCSKPLLRRNFHVYSLCLVPHMPTSQYCCTGFLNWIPAVFVFDRPTVLRSTRSFRPRTTALSPIVVEI